jgi:hypothetical protein
MATKEKHGGVDMADKNGLGILGMMFGGITLAVTLVAFLLVRDHVEGRLQLDDMAMAPQLISAETR